MQKFYFQRQVLRTNLIQCHLLLAVVLTLFISLSASAQNTIVTNYTSGGLTSGTASGGDMCAVFAIRNNNSGDMLLTELGYYAPSSTSYSWSLWMKPTPLTGSPGAITTANGWTQIAGPTSVPAPASSSITTLLTNINHILPANTTRRYAVVMHNSSLINYYGSGSSPNIFSAGGVDLLVGDNKIGTSSNVGYTGSSTGPGFQPRFFLGKITVMPAAPCSAPPTAGSATISNANPCPNSSVILSLSGNSFGLTQTYLWQSASSATGPWTNITTPSAAPNTTVSPAVTTYYRAQVTCNNQSSFSTPILANVPTLFPGGTYTINQNAAASSTNFQSFNDALNAMYCGIGGPVTLNVVSGSGPYNEQVTINQIPGLSSTNSITINGNNEWLVHGSTNSSVRSPLLIDGADFLTFNDLNIKAMGGSYGFGVHLTNDADNNTFEGCEILVDTNSTSSNYVGIAISGSYTSATTSGSDCDNNTFNNNTIHGGYYGYTQLGTSSSNPANSNKFIGNHFRNFYYYGGYNLYATNSDIIGNEFERPSRTSTTTTYGIYMGSGTEGFNVLRNKLHDFHSNYSPSSSASLYAFYTSSADGTSSNPIIIANNLVYNMNSRGTVRFIYESSSTHIHWLYNTFINQTTSTSGTFYGAYMAGSTAGRKFLNNIIYLDRPGGGTKYGIYKSTSSAQIDIDHNNIYFAPGTTAYYGYAGGVHNTLSDWQNATGHSASSVQIDPLFVDMNNGDLSPASFPFDNLGTPVSNVTDDYYLTARHPVLPDIGAVEFNPCKSPDSLMETNVGTDVATLSWSSPAGSAGSEYIVNNSAATPTVAGTFTSANQLNLTNLTPGTLYFYHIRNQCMSPYTSYWKTDSFFTLPCTLTTPTLVNSGNSIICEGNITELSIPIDPNATYTWYKNDTLIVGSVSNTFLPFETGSYRVEMEIGGCLVTSDSLLITVQPAPDYTFTTNDVDICVGASTILEVNTNNTYSYQWRRNGIDIPGATNQTYTANQGGAYRVLVSTINCTDTSLIRNVVEYPQPMPVIDDSNVPVLTTAQGFLSYQWRVYGVPIANSNSHTWTTTQNGFYTVVVVDSNGCKNESPGVQIGPSGVNQISAQGNLIKVYPNPTSGKLNIVTPEGVHFVLQSVDGKVIYQKSSKNILDMSALAEGVYFLRFTDKDDHLIRVERIVKTSR